MSKTVTGATQLWSILREKLEMLSPDLHAGEAQRLAERLVDVARRAFPAGHLSLAESLETLADLYTHGGRSNDAEPILREVFSIHQGLGEDADPIALLRTGTALASIESENGRDEEAVRLYEMVTPLAERTSSVEATYSANLHVRLAIILNRLRRDEEAEAHYRSALEIHLRTLDADDPRIAFIHEHLGEFYVSRDREKEAEQEYARALRIRRLHGETDPNALARAYGNLAVVHHSAAHAEEAEALYASALEILDRRGGRLTADEIAMLQNFAALLQSQGRKREIAKIEKRIGRA